MELHLLFLVAVVLALMAVAGMGSRRALLLAVPVLLLPELDLLFLPRAALHSVLLPAGLLALGLWMRRRARAGNPWTARGRRVQAAGRFLPLVALLLSLHLLFDLFGSGAAVAWPVAPDLLQVRADLGVTIERQLTVREYTETGAREYFNASLYRAEIDLGPRTQGYELRPFKGEWVLFRSAEFGAALFLLAGLGARWLLRKRFPLGEKPGS